MKRAIAPATAVVAWAAVLVQLVLSIQHSMARGDSFLHATVDYFAYFTVLTNVLVALVLTVPWLAPESPMGRWLARPHMTAMTATAIIIVGLTYHFLLSGAYNPVGIEYATDLGMHYLVPTLFTLYWVLAAPKAGLSYSHLPFFAIYPFAYLAFLVVRGAVVSEYPYFFVDVNTLGFAVAARNAMGLVLLYFMIAALLLLITTKHRVKEGG